MNKHIFTFLLISLCSLQTFSQQLNRQMKVDSLWESSKVVMETDKSYVLVHSQVPNLRFDSNRRIDQVNKLSSGDWEVWLPAGTHILKIDAEGFQRLELPATTFAKKRSYEMKIVAVGFASERRSDENLFEIVFQLNEDNVYSSFGDYSPTLTKSKTISYKLPQADYTFRFQKEGFADETKTISVTQNQSVDITMKAGTTTSKFSLPGIIIITSEPSGAEVLVNGQKVGTTRYQGELTAGNHQLELRKPLYYPDVSSFELKEGETKSLPIKLRPRFGFLSVTSSPTNGNVTLDGKPIGTTPITKKEIESAQHTIKVTKELYHDYTETFDTKDGDEKNISADLKPAFGSLEVTSTPEQNAEVFLDGKNVGKTPYTNTQLASGKYLLKLSKDLYSDIEEEIFIEDEKTTTKTITLNKNFGEIHIAAEQSIIYLNGKEVGKETYSARLSAGRYTMRAERGTQYTPDEKEMVVSNTS